jgi:predicted nucleotidyltransferase
MTNLAQIKIDIVTALQPLNPEKIILFGSYAYGAPTEDSDLDICIIEKKYKSRWEEMCKARALLKDLNLPIDILIPYHEEYEFYKKECGSVYKDIEDRGEVLWHS